MLDRMINAQAYVLSADDIFYASAVIFLLLMPLCGSRGRRRAQRTPAARTDGAQQKDARNASLLREPHDTGNRRFNS